MDIRRQLGLDSRRRPRNLLLRPALQLKLPAYILGVTVAFAALWVVHAWVAYHSLITTVLEHTQGGAGLEEILGLQTRDLMLSTAGLAVLYVSVVFGICVVYGHHMVGPTVAFQRHTQALQRGETAHRVRLRKGDAFTEVAQALNELAETLEKGDWEANAEALRPEPPTG